MKKKKKRKSGDMSLQITSMADIFMILLVFLLKSYSTSLSSVAPTAHLSLPEVDKAQAVPKETLKIEVAQDTVIVDDKPILQLKNFEFGTGEETETGGSQTLTRILNEQRKKTPEPNMESSIVVMADQGTPYSTVKRVVASAASAGFVDLQLLVVAPE